MMRNGYGHMVLDHLVARVRGLHAERAARLAALGTREEALAYRARVRTAIASAFGPWPERTPLHTQVTGVLDRPAFRLEKVLLESRPGLWVTANLYLPSTLREPAPAVLGTCGHAADGKASPLYQAFCQWLVRSGFVVLIFDPINQGERDQYVRLTDRESVRACTSAHNMMGKQLSLLGENLAMWRAWDGIRALDYLLSRPEVDPRHVGVTGNSGGGTMSTWLWAIEPRLTMAAPSCFVTTFLHNLENELPADCEQYPPGVLGAGLEMADFLIARAPEPLILLGQRYDFFDRRGFEEARAEVQRVYELLGASASQPLPAFAHFVGPHPHGFHLENQEAMVRFFARHAGIEQIAPPEEITLLSEEELRVTAQDNVILAGATPIYALIAERAQELARQRDFPSPRALRAHVGELLGLPPEWHSPVVPHYRVLRPVQRKVGSPAENGEGREAIHVFARYAVETEGDIRAILYRRIGGATASEALPRAHSLDVADGTTEERVVHLYLPHLRSEEDLTGDPLALRLQEKGECYGLDVRGLGESMPDEEGPFWQSYGMDYMFHGHGELLSESYLGRRVRDVLITIDLLVAEGASQVLLYGRGQGALLALFAALLHPAVAQVTLKHAPRSYQTWAHAPLVDWPAANFVRDALRWFDLDECLRVLEDRVTLLEPWDERMKR